MKPQKSNAIGFLCLLLTMMFPVAGAGQENMGSSREKKLENIDRDIAAAQHDANMGIIKLIVGAGVETIGYIVFLPTTEVNFDASGNVTTTEGGNMTLWWTSIAVGSVLEIWGTFQWWDAAMTLSQLKAKRYDLSFRPTLMPNARGDLSPGLAMQMRF